MKLELIDETIAKNSLPEIAVDVTSLPSKGLAYPKNSSIKYIPYTVGDVKKVSQSKLGLKDTFCFLLEGIFTSFDKLLLTIPDVLFLGLLRKISSFSSSSVIIPFTCSKCKKDNEVTVNFTSLEFQDISAPALPVIITISNREYRFMPLTLKNFFFLLDKGMEKDDVGILAAQCVNVEFDAMYRAILDFSLEDYYLMQEVDRLLFHAPKPIEVKCVCGNLSSVELEGGQALVLPFRSDYKSIASRIRFGS